MKLFEVRDKIEFILATMIDDDGLPTEEAYAELDQLDGEAEQLSLDLVAYMKGELAEAKAVKEEADKLKKRADGHKARAESIKGYLKKNTPLTVRYSDARGKIGWKKSPGKAVLEDEAWANDPQKLLENVDLEFVETIPEQYKLKRNDALKALRAGEIVRGFKLEKEPVLDVA